MTIDRAANRLVDVLGRLISIGSSATDMSDALRQTAELCRDTLGSRACTIALVDGDKHLIHEACVGFDDDFVRRNIGRRIILGSNQEGAFLTYETVARAVMVEAFNLQEEGNGYANPKTARRYELRSMLSCPIESRQQLLGYLTHFSADATKFTDTEKIVIRLFANHIALLLARFQPRDAELRRNVIYTVYGGAEPPVYEPELREMLTLIAEQCAGISGTAVCLVHLWNEDTQRLELKAQFPLDYSGVYLNEFASVDLGEGLIGQVARTQLAQRSLAGDDGNGELSTLSVPVRLYSHTVATVTVIGSGGTTYTAEDQRLLESVVASIPVAIERAAFHDSFRKRGPRIAESTTIDGLLRELAHLGREWLHESVCLVWLLDKDKSGFALRYGPSSLSESDKNELFLPIDMPALEAVLLSDEPTYVQDLGVVSAHFVHRLAIALDWKSILTTRIRFDGQIAGVIAICSVGQLRVFKPWHMKLFASLAAQGGAALRSLTHSNKLEKVIQHAERMQGAREESELHHLAIAAGRDILDAKCGCFRGFSVKTGRLALLKYEPQTLENFSLEFGEGVTGQALQRNGTTRVDDVTGEEWGGTYRALWPGQRSELAVPVILGEAMIRKGSTVSEAPKVLGVLNFESPTVGAFSEFDEQCVGWLGRHAARIMERIDFDRKLGRLRKVATEITAVRDWEAIIRLVLKVITETLGYDHVNISLVTSDSIKTVYVAGVEDADKFKTMSDHALSSSDIQADIVRNRRVEVIDGADDPRLDRDIVKLFHHEALIRVFVPMIVATDNRVIGTVEAGFRRSEHRKYIYERDVGILEQFVEYATMALEKKSNRQLAMISHELNAPLGAIRNNASFLKHRIHQLGEDKIQRKCDDILADAEAVQFHISQLEFALGHRPAAFDAAPRKAEPIVFFRDIIIKTVNALRPLARDFNLDPSRIEYDPEAVAARYVINSDKTKLSQVVFNLFTNAIKYAAEPSSFRIWIGAFESGDRLVIQFKDWGIGIDDDFADRIFDDGTRSPEAIAKGISGSGIGLTISKKLMIDLGGDLMLANRRNPTEFNMILPKADVWRRHDPIR
jgi:signal transduction histidine kinase/putative methionine-R-sulfoxide reductase with GAF domain